MDHFFQGSFPEFPSFQQEAAHEYSSRVPNSTTVPSTCSASSTLTEKKADINVFQLRDIKKTFR